jgi:hypothetical protein
MIKLSSEAQANVDETGADPEEDAYAIRHGETTREKLLAECLDGADEDRVQGWHEYVDAVCEAAGDANPV